MTISVHERIALFCAIIIIVSYGVARRPLLFRTANAKGHFVAWVQFYQVIPVSQDFRNLALQKYTSCLKIPSLN